jgi:sugar (pentulose or hexulose) kinase
MGAAMSVILGIDIGTGGAGALVIRAELENLIDVETWNEALSKETANRATLGEASKNWAEVEKYLRREARNV